MYRSYKFRSQDPVISQVKTMFLETDGFTKADLARESGLAKGTIGKWFNGATRHPRNDTIEAAGRAMGYTRKWVRSNTLNYK